MATERPPLEMFERGGVEPPQPPISRDEWWTFRKEFQEFQAAMQARQEAEDRLHQRYQGQVRLWQFAVTLLFGSTVSLLGILLTFLLKN